MDKCFDLFTRTVNALKFRLVKFLFENETWNNFTLPLVLLDLILM